MAAAGRCIHAKEPHPLSPLFPEQRPLVQSVTERKRAAGSAVVHADTISCYQSHAYFVLSANDAAVLNAWLISVVIHSAQPTLLAAQAANASGRVADGSAPPQWRATQLHRHAPLLLPLLMLGH